MALPSTGKKATATPSNPGSALTDFTFIVDLSDLPQAWWDDVNTSDGTRGRAAKNDETTELPVDWIDFDETAQTGLARIKYTGTKSASVSEPVIIYPPNTRNTAYAATDTYGQYNAYVSDLECYYPDGDGTSDRTENQLNMSSTGTITGGGATGLLGAATTYGTGAYYDTAPVTDRPVTMLGWIYPTNTTPDTQTIIGLSPYQTAVSANASSMWRSGDNAHKSMCRFPNWAGPESTNAIDTLNIWYHTAAIYRGTDAADSIVDGGGKSSLTSLDSFSSVDTITLGAVSFLGYYGNFDMFQGRLQELAVYSAGMSDDFISYEYSQTSDNSTFWGTWAVSDVSGGTNYTGGVEQDQSIAGSLLIKSLFTGGVEQDQTIGGTITIVTEETAFAGGAQQPQNIGGTLKLVLSFAGVVEQGQTVAGTLKIVGADTNFSGGISQEQEISGIINVEDNRIVFAGGIEQTQGIGGGFTVVIQPTAFIGGIEQEQEISGYFRSLIEITPDIITCPGAIQRTVTLNGIIQTTLTIKGELS